MLAFFQKRLRLAWLPLVVLTAAGCGGGPEKCYLEGRVTFQGNAVAEDHIVFYAPATGTGASAVLDEDGAYRIEEPVPPGDYIVTIVALAPPPGMGPVKTPPPKPGDVPRKYRQEKTTDLRPKVTPGKNRLDFDLKP